MDVTALGALFPLTSPIPTVVSHPDLVPINELALELDLVRSGSSNIGRWIHHIANVQAGVQKAELAARGTTSSVEDSLLGKKLASAAGRKGLQRLTDLYERALQQFPGSYKIWKQYLDMRASYVLGTPKRKVNLKAPKKKRGEGADDDNLGATLILKYLNEGIEDPETGEKGEFLTDAERDVDGGWEDGLDGIVGAEEWRSLAGTYERALMWLPRVCAVR
jgi:pre-mRNA-splicing factor SYF1